MFDRTHFSVIAIGLVHTTQSLVVPPQISALAVAAVSLSDRASLEDAVCGTQSSGGQVASDTRTTDTWTTHNIGQWFNDAAQGATGGDTPYSNIQSLVLSLAGHEGVGECDEITNPNCGVTGEDFNLCRQYPEAHFVWDAITNWANFLKKVHDAFDDSAISVGDSTSNLVKYFFKPQTPPQKLLVPIGWANGIVSALSVIWGPLGLLSAGATVAGAIVTDANINTVNPLTQWAGVETALAGLYTQTQTALQAYFDDTLKTVIPAGQAGLDYVKNTTELPHVLSSGAFAQIPQVTVFPPGIFGALATTAINALWVEDGVFMVKMSDSAYGRGPGSACGEYQDQGICVNGVAWILLRWHISTSSMKPVAPHPGPHPSRIRRDPGDMFLAYINSDDAPAWGIGPHGAPVNGAANANHLTEFKLSLDDVMHSIDKTYSGHGFPFTNQNGATLDELTDNPTDFEPSDLTFFSLPVCDIDAVFAKIGALHFNQVDPYTDFPGPDDFLLRWVVCTCQLSDKWPTTAPYTFIQLIGGNCAAKAFVYPWSGETVVQKP